MASKSQWCPGCGFKREQVMHFRVCVPKREWPEWLINAPKKPGPLVATTIEKQVVVSLENQKRRKVADVRGIGVSRDIFPCSCGFVATNKSGLTRHKKTATVHQTVVVASEAE